MKGLVDPCCEWISESRSIHVVTNGKISFFFMAAAAAAKSLQSCPTLCDPIDGSPPGSPVPGILQARTLEWVAISFSKAWKWEVKVKSLSRVQLFTTPWTAENPHGIFQARVLEWGAIALSVLWLSITQFCAYIMYTTSSLSVHLLIDPRLLPYLGCCN